MICFDLAIDQIAQSGLSSLKVIYYSAQLFSGKRYPIDVKMIAPFSDEVMKVTGLNGKASSAKVHFYAINDFGGAIEGNASL
ncbi:chaperone protein EcpD [Shigella sonnei]|nr:chaperone protein EcpD [Shigella sonnei]